MSIPHSRIRRIALGIAAVFPLALLAACGAQTGGTERPDIVLLVLDTMRADSFAYQGEREGLAPFLDRLASEGAVFPEAFSSSSWTAPSTATLMTGVYPDRHGVRQGFLAQVRHAGGVGNAAEVEDIHLARIRSTVPTLAESLAGAGYRTFGIATNINIGPEMGFDRGFDRFRREEEWSAGKVANLLADWKEDLAAASPFFLYLHLNDVHKPYDLRKKWFHADRLEEGRPPEYALYQSEIGYLDHWIEEMWKDLELGEDTLLVVVSDHGEEFLDHGGMGHHLTLFQEVNRILYLFHGPGLGIRPGVRAEAVSGIDLLPTILSFAGVADVPGARDGVSLVPLLRAEAGLPEDDALERTLSERTLFAHRWGNDLNLYAAIQGGWKRIEGPFGTWLYDLRVDRTERNDLSKQEPDRLRALGEALEAYRARDFTGPSEETDVGIDDELLRKLEELGYVSRQ